jgi:DNA invertase Pin-like site-specific DNA recombinase
VTSLGQDKETTGVPIGYARVSTADQDPALQQDALEKTGCVRIFTDKASGKLAERPGLAQALDYLRPGDTLTVWKLDRLGRSLQHLISVVTQLEERGVAFRSLTEGFDTSSPGGRLIFHVFGSLAEFERSLIVERTRAGLEAARARGRKGGRKPVLTREKIVVARQMHAAGEPPAKIARVLGCGRSTLYRYLGERETPGVAA